MKYCFGVILAVGLLLGTGCGEKSSVGVTVDAAVRPLVPSDTTALAGVDLAALRKSALYQRYQGAWNGAQLDVFRERFGIDPRRDISALYIVANGKGNVVALARGAFAAASLEQKLTANGVQTFNYKGHRLFGDGRESITIAKDGAAVAGSINDLHHWIDGVDAGGVGIPQPLQRRLKTLPQSDSIWVVSEGGLPLAGVALRPDVQSALSNIEGFVTGTAAGVAVNSGVQLQANFDCISNEGAHRVHDALKGGIGLARLTTKDNALDMLRLYDAVQVMQDGQTVRVRADWSGDLLDKVWGQLQQTIGRANRALSSGQ